MLSEYGASRRRTKIPESYKKVRGPKLWAYTGPLQGENVIFSLGNVFGQDEEYR
jgi:hypothetical protein